MTWLAEKVLPYRWLLIGLVFATLLSALGAQTVRLANSRAELAGEKAERAREDAKRYAALTDALQQLSDQRAAHAAAQQESADVYAKEQIARHAAEADAAAARRWVRDYISTAAGGDQRDGVGAGTCGRERDRARTLGDLLAAADGLAERLAGAAERHAGEVRLLKRQVGIDRAGCRPLKQ